MRLLLDECVPRPLCRGFGDHDVRSVQEMGWAGVRNGALLERAAAEFDALFTVDRDFGGPPLTTGSALRLIILAAGTTDPVKLQPLVPAVLAAIETAQPGQFVIVGG